MDKELNESLKVMEQTKEALELDLMLLEMERKQDMMDGLKMEEWIL